MKRIIAFLLLILLSVAACSSENQADSVKNRYSDAFFDTFDTLVQVVAYTDSEAEFKIYMEHIHSRFSELHQLYNIYLNYEGINNMKTINDQAGIAPVEVDQQIIDLILFAKEHYEPTGQTTNIALGPVTKIWHFYRTEAEFDPLSAKVPPLADLQDAARYASLDQVIIDQEKRTVFLPDSRMSLDVGAIAKGYATELVAQELIEMGLNSALLSPGGNIRAIGKPLDGMRDQWGVGIQNPEASIVA